MSSYSNNSVHGTETVFSCLAMYCDYLQVSIYRPVFLQDNMSPGHSQTSGSDDMSRASGRTVPFTYYEPPQCLPHPQFGTQSKRKCSGTVNVVPDHNGELREYFVLDTDTTMGRNKKTAQFGQGPGRPTGPSGSMGDRWYETHIF